MAFVKNADVLTTCVLDKYDIAILAYYTRNPPVATQWFAACAVCMRKSYSLS